VLESQFPNGDYDYADDYGEPGYSTPYGAETPMVLIGDWWCRCGANPAAGKPKGYGYEPGAVVKPTDLHDVMSHHPRLWAKMEEQGVQFEWHDEWWIDSNASKAYRTQADSYSWQSSIQWNEDICDYLTPDDDFADWLEWALNNPGRCLMRHYDRDVKDAGFVKWEPTDPHDYYNGWHDGMEDDPREIIKTLPDGHDYVFVLDETSQFYVGFSCWTRPTEEDE
jgi:hypothetical protein